MRAIILAGAALHAALGGSPAVAETQSAPPSNPCVAGSGTSCGGSATVVPTAVAKKAGNGAIYSTPAAISITRPSVTDRGVYIAQVGDANRASVSQTAARAEARVEQSGARNVAAVTQRGTAIAYANLLQSGVLNDAAVTQGGSGGGNIARVSQRGTGNVVGATQNAMAGAENGAVLSQIGSSNTMSLAQNGADNQAVLTQDGSGNAMSVSQDGVANRLVWTQQGDHLANLTVAQTGGQAMQITQTR